MTRIAYTLGALLCAVSIAAAATAAGGNSRGAKTSNSRAVAGSTSANESTARTDAATLLGKLTLPADATRAPTEPADDGSLLANPGVGPLATPNVVDEHAWWVLPGKRADVLAYIDAHPPAGSTKTASSEGGVGGMTTSESVTFGWPAVTNVLATRWLVIEVVQLPTGVTGLRADAQVVWVTPRAASERIPPGARVVRVAVRRELNRRSPTHRSLEVTSTRRIDRVVALLNALPVGQPGVRNCPADFGVWVRLEFDAARGAAPLAVAEIDPNGCGAVRLEIGGRRQPSLESEPLSSASHSRGPLLGQIERILGIHLNTRP